MGGNSQIKKFLRDRFGTKCVTEKDTDDNEMQPTQPPHAHCVLIDGLIPIRQLSTNVSDFTQQSMTFGVGFPGATTATTTAPADPATYMTGEDLVHKVKMLVLSSLKSHGAECVVLAFDKVDYLPMAKSVEHAKRRMAKKGAAVVEDDDNEDGDAVPGKKRPRKEVLPPPPLVEPVVGRAYITLQTTLNTLGDWSGGVMSDRTMARSDFERSLTVKCSDGNNYRCYMGRRKHVISFIVKHLVPCEYSPSVTLERSMLLLPVGTSLYIDGHCCRPSDFMNLNYFVDPPAAWPHSGTDWNSVPLEYKFVDGYGPQLRFATELQNFAGEADFSLFTAIEQQHMQRQRCLIKTVDTDSLLAALMYIDRLRKRARLVLRMNPHLANQQQPDTERKIAISITTRHANFATKEVTMRTEYWDMNALYDCIVAEFEEYRKLIDVASVVPHVVTALVASGCDYVDTYFFVTPERFWQAVVDHFVFVDRLCVSPEPELALNWQDDSALPSEHVNADSAQQLFDGFEVDEERFRNLILGAYAKAHASRLVYKMGDLRTTLLSQARLYLADEEESSLAAGGRKVKPIDVKKWIPSDTMLHHRWANTRYAMKMLCQVGVSRLHLDTDENLVVLHGYAKIKDDEPVHHYNLNFAHLA